MIFGPSPTLAELIGLQLTLKDVSSSLSVSFSPVPKVSEGERRTTTHFPDQIKII